MTARKKALAALLLVSVLWGTAGVTAKILIQELNPFVVLFYRFGFASLVLLPWFIKAHKPANMWRALIPFSLLSIGNAVFFYLGIVHTTAIAASVINTSTPLLTAFFSHVLINERTSKEKIAGIVIGLFGTLIIILLPLWKEGESIGGDFIGNLFILLSVTSWTLYLVGSRKFISQEKFSPIVMTEINFLTLTCVSLILALSTGQSFFTRAFYNPSYVLLLIYATIPVTVITFGLFQWVIKHVSATTASLKDYVQLTVGVGLSLLILGEAINTPFIIGSAIVILGVGIGTGKAIWRTLRG